MIPAVTSTQLRPIEKLKKQLFMKSYGSTYLSSLPASSNSSYEIHPAVMIPAVTPFPTQLWPIESFPQQLSKQSYEPTLFTNSAATIQSYNVLCANYASHLDNSNGIYLLPISDRAQTTAPELEQPTFPL